MKASQEAFFIHKSLIVQEPSPNPILTLSENQLKTYYRLQLINHSAASLLAYLICFAGHNLYTWLVCYLNDMSPVYFMHHITTQAEKEAWNISNVTEIYLFAPVLSLFTGAVFWGLYRITLQSYTWVKLLFLWLGFWFLIRSIGAPFAGAITFKEMGYYLLWNFSGNLVVRMAMALGALLFGYLVFRQILASIYQCAPVFDLVLAESGDQSRRRQFVLNTVTLPCLITLLMVVLAFVPGPTRVRFWMSFTFRHELFLMLYALINWLVIYRSIQRFSSDDVMLFKNHLPAGIAYSIVVVALLTWVLVRIFHETALF